MSRELAYAEFIKQHAPSKCDVFLGGYLFDDDGAESKQLDIIITTGLGSKSETILALDTTDPDTKCPIPVLCTVLSLAMNDVFLPSRYCLLARPI